MQDNTCGKPPAAGGLLRRIRDLFDPRRVMRRRLTRLVAVAFALVALIGFGTFAILRLAEMTSEEPLPPMRDQIYHDYSAMLQFYPERNDLRMPTAEEMRFLAPLWPRIPPERNAAFYFAKAVSLMTWEDAPPGSASANEPYAGDRAAFERWVRASQPALNAVLQGLPMKTCRFPAFMDRKTGHPELGTAAMGLLASVRHIGRTCTDAGFVMELGENPEGAAEWYMACMRLGEYVRRDSVLIENFVGVALCLIGQAPLDALVANAPLSDDTLKKVIAACRSAEATSGELSRIWVAEEAFVQASVRSGKKRIRPRGLHRRIQKVIALPLPELLRKSGRDRLLKKKFTIYESAKMAARPRGVRRGFPTFSFFSWVRQQVLLDLMMRVTRIRAAIALFQRRHGGKAPEDLEALCPEILPKVPIDPFSGKPMRYARIGDGWKLWSVGDDHVDNQGRGTPWPTPRGCRRAPDIIFTSTKRTNLESRSGGKLSAADSSRKAREGTARPPELLAGRVSFSFDETPLREALGFFRNAHRIQIEVFDEDKALLDSTVTVTLDNVPAWQALQVLARCAHPKGGLYLRRGRVYIGATRINDAQRIVAPQAFRKEAGARLDKTLKRNVKGFSFDEAPLRDVLGFFKNLVGPDLNIVILLGGDKGADRPVTLERENISIGQALHDVAEVAGVANDYDLFPGIVTVVPRRRETG